MVSMRYFCGVGEFCRVKYSPLGALTSNTGVVSAAIQATDSEIYNARKKYFSNLIFLAPSISRFS